MLDIHSAKNVSLESINFQKHFLILMKIRERVNREGGITTTINYIEVCKLKNNDPLTAIEELLKHSLAELRVACALEKEFAATNATTQRRLIMPFLKNETAIFVTDSEGKLFKVIKSEIPFDKTAFALKEKHTIATCRPEKLKIAIRMHAKLIFTQCNYISLVGKEVSSIIALCNSETVTTAKKTEKTAIEETAKVA
jgi:hypothetical protein